MTFWRVLTAMTVIAAAFCFGGWYGAMMEAEKHKGISRVRHEPAGVPPLNKRECIEACIRRDSSLKLKRM